MSKPHRRGIRRVRRHFHAVEAFERRLLLSSGGYTAGGIHGYYYASSNLSGPAAFDRQDVRIDFDWRTVLAPGGSNSPGFGSIGHNNFSVRWTGQVVAANSQTYTFTTLVDSGDGARLLIRPAGSTPWTTVIDDWTAGQTSATGTLAMTAGATYDIEMDYSHATGAAEASLHWSSPSIPDQVINPMGVTGINAETYGPVIYADAMKSGRNFWEGGAAQDANGWPLEDATNIPWEGVDAASVTGTYLLTFSGEADMTADIGGQSILSVNGATYYGTLPKGVGYNAATNTTTATLTIPASNSGILSLEFKNSQRTAASATDTGVTNVQLMKPTSPGASTYYPPGTLFTTAGKAAMSAFTTERWLTTNQDTQQVNWSDRVLPSYFKADVQYREVWEDLVAFANETGKDLYITIPMNASSDYVTKLAELIKYGSDGINPYTSYQANPVYQGLNPNLKVYVEWSNETWNPGFFQYQAGVQDSQQAVQNGTSEGQIINYDGSSPNGNWQRWMALKTVEASNTFRAVWGDAAMGNSVRMLLEYQYYNLSDSAYSELGFINNYFDNGDGVQHVITPHPVSYYLWGAGGPNYYEFNNPLGTQTATTVPDFSFESPSVAAGTAQLDPAGGSWAFSGNSGIYDPGSTSSVPLGAIGTPPVPTKGAQAAFIGDTGSISTTINFAGTGVFAIQLDAAIRIGAPDPINVYIDGQSITPFGVDTQPTYIAWTPGFNGIYNTLDTAPFSITTPGNHTLTITGTGASGTYDYFDNIQVASDDAIFNSGIGGVATVDSYQGEINLEARYAEEYGLNFVSYEGGWASVGSPLLSYAEFVDPRIGQTTTTSIDDFAQAGGSLYLMGTYESWPVNDTQNATTYPAYQAVLSADATPTPARTTPAPHLFFDTDQPAVADQNVNNSAIAAAGGAELGMKFQSDLAGYITGVRFWTTGQNTGTHTGELWSDNGQRLATVTFPAVTTGGWQLAYFSSPVQISANTTYIVSYHTTSPGIADTPGAFANTGINNQNLHGLAGGVDGPNGVYALGSSSAFPNSSEGQSPNYWVDAIFSDHVPVAPSTPFNMGVKADSPYQVTVYWGDSAGEVTEYDVERSTDGVNYTLVGQVYEKWKYVDTNVQPGATYYYRLSAQNAGSHSWTEVMQITTPVSVPAKAAFVATDNTTSGNWTSVYGSDGYDILGTSNLSVPAYARLSVTAGQPFVWEQNPTETRAPLIAPGSTSRIASCDYSNTSFTLNLNLIDGQTHEVALYLLDEYAPPRSETVQVIDAITGSMLNSQSVTNFANGQWLVWNLSGNVEITITNTGGTNAVATEIAFGPKSAPVVPKAAAAFITTDTTTSGNWTQGYGADGYDILGTSNASLPAYAQVSVSGARPFVWEQNTTDPRATPIAPGSATRVASCDYANTSFTIGLNLTDGQTHQVALYLLDEDPLGRSQTVQVIDVASGAVLDTRSVTNFSGGKWLVWNLSGNLDIKITNAGGWNVVASAIMFGGRPATVAKSTAAFVATDNTTSGTWTASYGADGYDILGSSYASLPAYAQLSATGAQPFTWQQNTSDPRATLIGPNTTARIASCDYSNGTFTLNLNLTDGKTHEVALYLLDEYAPPRSETVQVIDAATGTVLDTRSVTNFANGQWLVWNLSGDLEITVANAGGMNAVASAIAFGPKPAPMITSTAAFASSDTTTGGTWGGVYGSDGYSIMGGQTSLPAYAQLSITGGQPFTWASSTTDGRVAQQSPSSSVRTAACDYSYTSFTLDLNLTDGKAHRVGLYLQDYDYHGRAETIQIADAATGTVLDTRNFSQFYSGQWAFWNLSGHVKITITRTAADNAVLSGIVFDPVTGFPKTGASFVKADTTTLGHWSGVYGADGYSVFTANTSLPAYAQLTPSGAQPFTWQQNATDPRALQTGPGSASQIAACYYSYGSFTLDLNLTDGKSHQIALYLLDYDRLNRTETVQVSNAITGAALDTRSLASFTGGEYPVWNVSGHVRITITHTGGANAVASGIFFDPTAA